jgi:ABC-type dipeptide/oligopeptide/nickel transport system ATPase subunit
MVKKLHVEEQLESLKKLSISSNCLDDLVPQFSMIQKDIDVNVKTQLELNEEKNRIVEYEKQMLLETELKELECDEEILESKYNASILFRNKVLEAESITLESVIDAFNTHLKFYLDHFFDEPISISLSSLTEKDTKAKSRYQLQVNVFYKGMEYDIHQLSGGELNRVIVASTLSFCDIVGSPVVMLDESINNLDSHTAGNVIQVLNNIEGKSILLISHQAITGEFKANLQI